ncbi:PREDICTED: UDP-glycosyltransferase 91C1-like [Nelumbo nucifera]|uniref:UDP-glycosyltransferase 91C1-like n=2 Tax=Nelumbo nucifera TaxID=4432 RepID=A0A1U8AXG2_NELNU|nr:PREDICTED: UDP-glycosyltransferase 91C1-like [Nelumbo nucifera]DAD32237.1 TPA_asm: hypothetical protein HUJ06_011088 [Nelumbo nucifera]
MKEIMGGEVHVVMLPYLAFGHMIPFFHLSIALAKSGIRVSFVSTPRNIDRLPKPPVNLSALLEFVPFPLPIVPNTNGETLPPNAEATVDVPADKVPLLDAAYNLLRDPFKQFLFDKSPHWIIQDFLADWTIDIAKEFCIPIIGFSVFAAITNAFIGPPDFMVGDARKSVRPTAESLMSPPPWIRFESSLGLPSYEAVSFFHGFFGKDGPAEKIATVLRESKAVAIRTCPDFECGYFDVLETMYEKEVIPVGLLSPTPSDHGGDEEWIKILHWLDQQKPKSVLFVGFGSECRLSKEQIEEIARGVELSNFSFIWALRKSHWAGNDDEVLPQGFSSRTSGRGIVGMGWAPQLKILAHPSIRGSLFHSGWGSVIETLQYVHRLVLLPLIIDQGINAKLLVEKNLAIEVEINEDGSFSGESIAKALKRAMASEEGDEMSQRAKETAAIICNRLREAEYMNKFVKYLTNNHEREIAGIESRK